MSSSAGDSGQQNRNGRAVVVELGLFVSGIRGTRLLFFATGVRPPHRSGAEWYSVVSAHDGRPSVSWGLGRNEASLAKSSFVYILAAFLDDGVERTYRIPGHERPSLGAVTIGFLSAVEWWLASARGRR